MTERESELAVAARHVARAKVIIARQRRLIARLETAGCATGNAEQTLRLFLDCLEIFQDHERELRAAEAASTRAHP